ncbi:MAG: CPBP family intramembrane metalloprotease [Oscillospiraceae bacterium]|nr:CPBP family intramembrane metalloprotease [Oscillospiraceae bacterium]
MTKKKKLKPLILTEQEMLVGPLYLMLELTLLPTLITLLGQQVGGFSTATANYLYYWCNAVCCGLIFRKLLLESLLRAGQSLGTFLGTAVVGFLILLGANQVLTGLADLLIPDFVNTNNAFVADMVRQSPVTMTLSLVALVPLAEECLFRGLIFTGLLGKNRNGAYLLSVVGFCAIHVLGHLGSADGLTLAVCFLQYIPAGLVLAWSCEKSGSLFAPILIHAAVNAGSLFSLR